MNENSMPEIDSSIPSQHAVSVYPQDALDEFLNEGTVREETARRLFAERKLFPVCFGAALKNEGIEALLDTLYFYAPRKAWPEDFSACVYKNSAVYRTK